MEVDQEKIFYISISVSSIIIILLSAYTVYTDYMSRQSVVIYVLDPNKGLSGYPHTLVYRYNGSTVLYVGVENNLYSDAEVVIVVKIAGGGDVWRYGEEPCPAPIVYERKLSLEKGSKILFPLRLSINRLRVSDRFATYSELLVEGSVIDLEYYGIELGEDFRLVIELWKDGRFTGQWLNIWLKVIYRAV